MIRHSIIAALCGVALAGAAEAREYDRAPGMHVTIPEVEDTNVRREELLVRYEFVIDENDQDTWGVELFPDRETVLGFDFARDHVFLYRSITDMPNYNSTAFRSELEYASYDELGLRSGSAKKMVTVYSNPYFMWIEVSQSENVMSDVRTALFFVGSTMDEHEFAVNSGSYPLYDYSQFKEEVQEKCADTVRLALCPTTNGRVLSAFLGQ